MAPPPPWESLDLELVGRILAHLRCLAHRVVFSAVCVKWRAVAVQNPLLPQLPWMLLPAAAAEAPEFFCLLCWNTHRAFLPDDLHGARYCGSRRGGWLVLGRQPTEADSFVLHNLHTGERLDIPADLLYTRDGVDGNEMIVLGAAFSAWPNVNLTVLAVVLSGCTSQIAFWIPRIGMRFMFPPLAPEPHARWRRDLRPRAEISDVIFFAGYGLAGFHVLTETEEVLVYVLGFAPDGALTTRLVTYRFPGHTVDVVPGYDVSRYLVGYFGQLVMVVRLISREDEHARFFGAYLLTMLEEPGDQYGDRQASWKSGWFAANPVVVLGRCSSKTFFSPGLRLGGLYYLDDAKSFDDLKAMAELFPCTDMGRCIAHFQQREFHQRHVLVPPRSPSEFSPAVWFLH